MFDNYHNDYRVIAATAGKIFQDIDTKRKRAFVDLDEDELTEVKIEFAVCPTCEGTGSHVAPSIDCDGISREDLDADPDFSAAYFGGRYDVTCGGCDGARVVPVCSDPRVIEAVEADAAFSRQRAHERAMGY